MSITALAVIRTCGRCHGRAWVSLRSKDDAAQDHLQRTLRDGCVLLQGAVEDMPVCGAEPCSSAAGCKFLMSRPTLAIRIPYDSDYTALLGTAVYAFAYYEWVVIYLIQQFEPGFVRRYCRGSPMPSGDVKKKLANILNNPATSYTRVSRDELRACCDRFAELIETRNALIHAHPITDADGGQILHRQAGLDRPLPDMKWSKEVVERAIHEFDAAACEANALLHE